MARRFVLLLLVTDLADSAILQVARRTVGVSEARSRILERVRALRWLTEPDQLELSATAVH